MQAIVLDGVDTGAQCKDAAHSKGDYVMLMRSSGLIYAKVESQTDSELRLKTVTQTEWEIANSTSNPLTTAAIALGVAVLIALAACLGLTLFVANV